MAELEGGEEFPEEGLTPVVFQVDTAMSPLQAVMEFTSEGNPPGQRVAHILSIPAAAAESSLDDARSVLLPLLSQLAFDDHPDVKQATAEVLGPLGPILASKDPDAGGEGGSADAMDLLVLSHRLLQDAERGVQEAAASSVAQFAGLLSAEHRQEHLSAVIDALMHNYDDEQMQECAVDLLTKVAGAAGQDHPDWCEECALPRMVKLSMHRDYNIRVHSVSGLVALAACLPEGLRTGPLLTAFAELCADPVWSVRQDCAAELAALASRLPRDAVRSRLLPLWKALAGDVSAWVQAAARRQAGPLLSSLHPEDCSPELLDGFVAAAAGPDTLTQACAHYLPAVLQNQGMERWPQLREAAAALAASENVSVRVALAGSVHRLAALVGPDAVAQDLLPVIKRLSTDDHPAVADALAVNVAPLLAALPPGERLGQLAFLGRMHPEDGSSCGQWRMRLAVAEQLAGIAALLRGQGLAEVLLPATLRLCEDPVAAVREAAAAQLGGMVRGLLDEAAPGGGSGGGTRWAEEAKAGEQLDAQQEGQQSVAGAAAQAPAHQEEEQGQHAVEAAMQQLAMADGASTATEQPEGRQQAADAAAPAATAVHHGAEKQLASNAAGVQQKGSGGERVAEEEAEEEEEEQDDGQAGGQSGAVVLQIVRHMVELQRSSCHRLRQTYLLFCAATLMPPAATEQVAPEQQQQAVGEAQPELQAQAGTPQAEAAGAARADSPAAGPAWPALPASVANSGVVQGLLEGAVALAADPVPNVRLGVARLLCTLRRQQPALAAGSPRVVAALAALAGDPDRDVRQAAAE